MSCGNPTGPFSFGGFRKSENHWRKRTCQKKQIRTHQPSTTAHSSGGLRSPWNRNGTGSGSTRKAKQRAGACCIPYKKSYKCDGICDTCEFRCIPKDAPQHLSIDTEMENAYENGVSRTSFLADSRLTTEIDIDSLILNGLLTELQSSDPESYEILMAIADGLSERAGAERLNMPRNTFVYRRNQLLKRLKEKF